MVQDEDAAEYDYAASEWPSEYDDGAHYGTGVGRRFLTPKLHTTRLMLRRPMSMTTHGTMWRPMTLPMRLTWVPERGFSVVWQDLSELVGWLLVWLSYCVGLDGP